MSHTVDSVFVVGGHVIDATVAASTGRFVDARRTVARARRLVAPGTENLGLVVDAPDRRDVEAQPPG